MLILIKQVFVVLLRFSDSLARETKVSDQKPNKMSVFKR